MSAEAAARTSVEFLSLAHPQVREACVVALEPTHSTAIVAVPSDAAIALTAPCLVSPTLLEHAIRRTEASAGDLDQALLTLVERAATAAIVDAIRALGLKHAGDTANLETIERTGHVPARFRRILTAWLGVLTDDGFLEQLPGRQWTALRDLPDAEPDWAAVKQRAGASAALVDYLSASAANLIALIGGDRDPIALLFPSATTDIAEQLYKSNPVSAYLNHIAGAAVGELAKQQPGTLRVLEVGAGIGGTTDGLLPRFVDRRTRYCFTDVSSFLLARARQRYASRPWMRYATLDLNRDLSAQGCEPSSAHLVVAANVLHYANDARAGLEAVRRTLVPGGYLVAIESTRQARWQLISLAFLDGLAISDERSTAAMPLHGVERWQTLLTETGFDVVAIEPRPASSLDWIGAHVFVARVPQTGSAGDYRPGIWDLLHEALPPDRVPDQVVLRSSLPRRHDGTIDTTEIERVATPASADAANVQPATALERSIATVFETILNRSAVSVEENFFDLGADSLTAARACQELQHVVHRRIDVVDLLSHPNIRELAAHLSTTQVDSTSSLADERARKRLALMATRRRPSREEHQA